jgi:hypothetical protein
MRRRVRGGDENDPVHDLPRSAGPITLGVPARRIRIESRRGTPVSNHLCTGCGTRRKLSYFYRRTNHGSVVLCAGCRDTALLNRDSDSDAFHRRMRT